MFDRCIFKSVRPSLKNRANSRTEIDILAPSQYPILHFVHGWDKKRDSDLKRYDYNYEV